MTEKDTTPVIDLEVFTVLIGSDTSGNMSTADAIAHEGKLWVVPHWTEAPERRMRRPTRMIRFDHLPYQDLGAPSVAVVVPTQQFFIHGSGAISFCFGTAEVVRQLLNGIDARVFSPPLAFPFLDGEVRNASLFSDQPQGLFAVLQLAQYEIKQGLFHSLNLAIYGWTSKPQMASHSRYAEKMRREEQQNARAVLAENVKKLIARAGSQPALVRMLKVPQKTISRAKNDENAANLDTINDIAKGCRLQPWQLLVPGLDLDNPPVLATERKEDMERLVRAREDGNAPSKPKSLPTRKAG